MDFQLVSLSVGPNYFGVYLFLTIVFVFLILTAAAVALRHRKHRKIVAIATVAVLAVTASASIVWSTAASVDYWLLPDYSYSAVIDNAVTVYCENTGSTLGTFNLKIEFTNAEISDKTNQPYEQLDSETAKFTYTLQPNQKQTTQVHFTVNSDATDFYITLSGENGGNFLTKYNANGVNTVSYQVETDTGNYSLRTAMPPP